MTLATLKAQVSCWMPPLWLEKYRRLRMELPIRFRDAVPDLRDRLRRAGPLMPPARLRWGVGRTSSREEYRVAGKTACEEFLAAFRDHRDTDRQYPIWLDFGCGSGRICRHLEALDECRQLIGVDVDTAAIAWDRKHLSWGEFLAIDPRPPMPLASGCCDLIYAASVFTHFDEEQQFRWLAELRRLLKPGGLLLASTHSEKLVHTRQDLSAAARDRLTSDGFAFAQGSGRFNGDTAFHARRYLEKEWSGFFELKAFHEQGLFRFQDLSVWRRRGGHGQ